MKNVVHPKKIRVYVDSDRLQFLTDLKNRVNTEDVTKKFDVAFQKAHHNTQEPADLKAFDRNKKLALLDSIHANDVFIYDLNNCETNNLRIFLKLLKSLHLTEKKKLIILSNILTWENIVFKFKKEEEKEGSVISDYEREKENGQKENEAEEGEEDEEEEPADEEDEEEEENEEETEENVVDIEEFTENDYLKRKAKGKYQQFVDVENLAIDLSQSVSFVSVHIVCPGLVYGGNNAILFDLFKQAWLQEPSGLEFITSLKPIEVKKKPVKRDSEEEVEEEEEEEPEVNLEELNDTEHNSYVREKRLKKARNNIPMVHYSDLLIFIKFILLEEFSGFRYILAVDEAKKSTQIDLIKNMALKVGGRVFGETDLETCRYNEEIKRHLIFDVKLKTSSLFKDYKRKLKKLKEEEEAEEEVDEEEEEEGEEGEKKEEKVKEELIKYTLNFRKGFVKNITDIKKEFCDLNSLKSNRIIVIGDDLSGKTLLSHKLSKHFKIPYISIDSIVEEFLTGKSEFVEEVKTAIEEKQEELKTIEEEETAKVKKQNKFSLTTNKEKTALITEEMLIKIIKMKLEENICLNRGYVFDGFFRDYKIVSEIFRGWIISQKPRTRRR